MYHHNFGGVLHVCQACLTLSKEVQLIFGENQNEMVSMLRALSIELIDSDMFPKYLCLRCVEKIKSLHSFVEMFRNSQKVLKEAYQCGGENMIKKEIEGRHEWDSSEIIHCDSPSPPSFQEAVDADGGINVKNEIDLGDVIVETSQIQGENLIVMDEAGPLVCPRNNEPDPTCQFPIKSEFKSHQERAERPAATFAHTSRATIPQDIFAQEQGAQEEQIEEDFNQEQMYVPRNWYCEVENSVREQPIDKNVNDFILYRCQFCTDNFCSFTKFYQHALIHREVRSITCAFCEEPSEVFQEVLSYLNHINAEHKLLFICNTGHKDHESFEDFSAFWSHQKNVHDKLSLRSAFPKPLGIVSEDALYPWEKISTTKSLCPYCGEEILESSRFHYHIWTHFSHQVGGKECTSCGKVHLFLDNQHKCRASVKCKEFLAPQANCFLMQFEKRQTSKRIPKRIPRRIWRIITRIRSKKIGQSS